MPSCRMCEKDFATPALTRGICTDCRRQHGLPEYTEPLRPRVPCARCGGTTFVRAYAIRERAAKGNDYVSEYVAALSLSYELSAQSTFWGGREVKTPNLQRPTGLLEAYACRRCGFTELYTQHPDEIPIDEAHATELFEVESDTPYR
jgi:ribosomal protein S27AE